MQNKELMVILNSTQNTLNSAMIVYFSYLKNNNLVYLS